MLNETETFMEKFNFMLFKGKKNQLTQNRQNKSTDHTTIQRVDKRHTHSDYTEIFQCDAYAPLENIYYAP